MREKNTKRLLFLRSALCTISSLSLSLSLLLIRPLSFSLFVSSPSDFPRYYPANLTTLTTLLPFLRFDLPSHAPLLPLPPTFPSALPSLLLPSTYLLSPHASLYSPTPPPPVLFRRRLSPLTFVPLSLLHPLYIAVIPRSFARRQPSCLSLSSLFLIPRRILFLLQREHKGKV